MNYDIQVLSTALKEELKQFHSVGEKYNGSTQVTKQSVILKRIKELKRALRILEPYNNNIESEINERQYY